MLPLEQDWANMSKQIIEIKDLTFNYGVSKGVQNVNLSINEGEIFGFLGENGAGKTTTIRCMMNILIQQQGEIIINGHSVSRDDFSYKEEIGYLPGELIIPDNYKVKDFFAYLATLRTKEITRLNEVVELFDIPLNKKIKQLSKGNKQKLGIALALMHDPKILILDEPSSGLDPLLQQQLYKLLLQEKANGKTIFFSSHNLDEVQKICDRVAIIRDGEIVTVEDVKDLAKDVTRKIYAKVKNLDQSKLSNYTYYVDPDTEEVAIEVTSSKELNEIMDILQDMELLDLNYPPASLESFFLSKYRSN
ncbi:MAG: ABC transporter ATP-binding protein [Candidatus Heimdallarchaeota archaeon]|nr:ABC transporter ATP-binding protein [Candidatus Heimdallarchaeota archaeon]